jgi:hypothetical protein
MLQACAQLGDRFGAKSCIEVANENDRIAGLGTLCYGLHDVEGRDAASADTPGAQGQRAVVVHDEDGLPSRVMG